MNRTLLLLVIASGIMVDQRDSFADITEISSVYITQYNYRTEDYQVDGTLWQSRDGRYSRQEAWMYGYMWVDYYNVRYGSSSTLIDYAPDQEPTHDWLTATCAPAFSFQTYSTSIAIDIHIDRPGEVRKVGTYAGITDCYYGDNIFREFSLTSQLPSLGDWQVRWTIPANSVGLGYQVEFVRNL